MPSTPRYAIGIDLGTTNTAVAYVDLAAGAARGGARPIRFFEIPQLVAPGELGTKPVLPSFVYLPGAHDLPAGSTALPWDADRTYAVGELAREQGARVPGRLVASAKSWLCHGGVDRTAAILPWDAPEDVPRISPVEASRRYLQHVREAWNDRMAGDEAARFERQLLLLTVPASFDEVARELTVQAARDAGLPHVVLLEEPLAAFYAWLATHDAAERDALPDGALILVCDVGGGTSDFSIIGVRVEADGTRRFERLAVGDHLMLGGDNMDYALGRTVEAEIAGGPGRLDVRRWHQLVHQCRRAKERLLGEDAPEAVDVTVAGTGSRLIAGTLKGTLTRAEAERLLLDGFFPETPLDAPLQQGRRRGLTELGLPYEADPAITRHLAAFWRRARPYLREQTGRTALFPDYLLFNGGVFTPAPLRARLRGIVRDWFRDVAGADWTPTELSNPRLDLAVAMGAAYYGLVRRGEGIRVGSGSARAYYVGVAADQPEDAVHHAVCLVPRGAEEGFVGRLTDVTFEALANHPVTFHLYSSTTRTGDALGDVVALPADEVVALPPIRTALPFGKKAVARRVPVQLRVELTEVGTLALWCDSVHTEHRWQLQFDVRQEPETDVPEAPAGPPLDPDRLDDATAMLRQVFTGDGLPDGLWERLEDVLEQPRADWPMPVLRKLADTLLPLPRDRSAAHEVLWFDLLGYGLRPGYGDPVDAWRVDQAWKNYLEALHFPAEEANRLAWWRFWRRIGGGLPAAKQEQVYYDARPYVQLRVQTRKPHPIYSRRMKLPEKHEAWMTLASFERLSVDIKTTLGHLLLQAIKQDKPRPATMWALARLGARHPVYGPQDRLVPPDEVAAWLKAILTLPPPRRDYVAYALAQLARRTGDRDRDVPEDWFQQVYRWLRKMDDEAHYRALLDATDPAPDHPGQRWLLGEPLPDAGHALLDPQGIAVRTR